MKFRVINEYCKTPPVREKNRDVFMNSEIERSALRGFSFSENSKSNLNLNALAKPLMFKDLKAISEDFRLLAYAE